MPSPTLAQVMIRSFTNLSRKKAGFLIQIHIIDLPIFFSHAYLRKTWSTNLANLPRSHKCCNEEKGLIVSTARNCFIGSIIPISNNGKKSEQNTSNMTSSKRFNKRPHQNTISEQAVNTIVRAIYVRMRVESTISLQIIKTVMISI